MSKVIPVILAGGQGTRLWPASLPTLPKQFLTIGNGTLIEQAVQRVLPLGTELLILTSQEYLSLFSKYLPLPREQKDKITVIAEPVPRNTAPAVALALKYVQEKYSDAILLLITADHLIQSREQFIEDAQRAIELAQERYIVTFGIVPDKPETGYGYIECGEALGTLGYRARSFKEKPSRELAEQYLSQKNYVWNSGMFCFSARTMCDEFAAHSRELRAALLGSQYNWIEQEWGGLTSMVPNYAQFAKLEKISLDYAVMEHTKRAAVVPARFSWSDIGSWDEVALWMDRKKVQKASGSVYTSNAQNITVRSTVPVAVSGVSDLVVVCENNRVLVMRKGTGQAVSAFARQDAERIQNKTV